MIFRDEQATNLWRFVGVIFFISLLLDFADPILCQNLTIFDRANLRASLRHSGDFTGEFRCHLNGDFTGEFTCHLKSGFTGEFTCRFRGYFTGEFTCHLKRVILLGNLRIIRNVILLGNLLVVFKVIFLGNLRPTIFILFFFSTEDLARKGVFICMYVCVYVRKILNFKYW